MERIKNIFTWEAGKKGKSLESILMEHAEKV